MGNKINKIHQKLIEKQEQTLTASHSDVGLWTNHRTLDLDRTFSWKKIITIIYYLLCYNKNLNNNTLAGTLLAWSRLPERISNVKIKPPPPTLSSRFPLHVDGPDVTLPLSSTDVISFPSLSTFPLPTQADLSSSQLLLHVFDVDREKLKKRFVN